ncbi:MAG: DUF1963 domain-containing protein [Pseudomonadota bacterium]
MSRVKTILGVALLFGALAFCAAYDIPSSDFAGERTRSVAVLDWLVHTVATDNFGSVGGAAFYAVLGLFAVGFATVGSREPQPANSAPVSKRPSRPRKARPAADQTDAAPKEEGQRRRNLVAAAIIANEAANLSAEQSNRGSESSDTDQAPDQSNSAESDGLEDLRRVQNLYAEALASGAIPPLSTDPADQPQPAWGLMLASPWEDVSGYTSWLGGLPRVPEGFEWPRDPGSGKPMYFYAQIDLADLEPESETGATAPGLPEQGALLVFIGLEAVVRVISAEDMASAKKLALPDDMPTLEEFGYWTDAKTFPEWPVKPQAFLDQPYDEEVYWEEHDGEQIPEVFRKPPLTVSDWITNWGVAAFEAERVLHGLRFPIDDAKRRFDNELSKITAQDEREQNQADGDAGAQSAKPSAEDRALEAMGEYAAKFYTEGPQLVQLLKDWKDRAENHDPLEPVDGQLLDELFRKRVAFCDGLNATGPVLQLKGQAHDIWDKVLFHHRSNDPMKTLLDMPPEFRNFMEERITQWRDHRLFGIEPPFSNNTDDLRGMSCLISIHADPLLYTQTEHDYGISVWIPTEEMQAGKFDNTQVVRHCAV